MGKLRKSLPALAAILLLAFGVSATEPAAPTEPKAALHYMDTLPGNFSPLSGQTAEKEFLLKLTTDKLYRLSADGSTITPSMATAMPTDVTAEYAGTYGVPADAVRGYAFRIDLNSAACWADGTPITADDYLYSMEQLYAEGYFEFLAYREPQIESVVSLEEAGFASTADAQDAGYTLFFVDTSGFWGLENGWKSVNDRTRLRDYAMPSGLNEYFVTPAYLYNSYLAEGAGFDYLQSEFVGISAQPEAQHTFTDAGILKTGEHQITLILNAPTTATALALELEDLWLFREGVEHGSYGPYELVSADPNLIVLERNEHWWGDTDGLPDTIHCVREIGS